VATFIDRHGPGEAIPAAVRDQLVLEALHQVRNSHGVKPVAHWLEDGVIYCIVEAADVEAVCQHHAQRGLRCDDLHLISGVSVQQPISAADRAALSAAIDAIWHTM
jgi:(2Fe-2S) ferredoxin